MLLPKAFAGLDEFSYLDKIDNWIIERRVDSLTNQVRCRASIPGYYSWFGGRIRLDKEDKLIIPNEFLETEITSPLTIKKIRSKLQICRSGLLYLPKEIMNK